MAARLATAGVETASQIQGAVMLLLGRGGIKEDLPAVCERWVAANFRCVVYDARAHGQSGGESRTFGAREAGDLRQVIDATAARTESSNETVGPLVVWGLSLGAAGPSGPPQRYGQLRASCAEGHSLRNHFCPTACGGWGHYRTD